MRGMHRPGALARDLLRTPTQRWGFFATVVRELQITPKIWNYVSRSQAIVSGALCPSGPMPATCPMPV